MTSIGALGYAHDDLKLFYVRKEQKGHGSEQRGEGHLDGTEVAAMFEDVTTTGGSLIKAIKIARAERGANIKYAICILDREMGARENLAAIGVELLPIFTATQIGLKTAA